MASQTNQPVKWFDVITRVSENNWLIFAHFKDLLGLQVIHMTLFHIVQVFNFGLFGDFAMMCRLVAVLLRSPVVVVSLLPKINSLTI